MNEYTSPDDLRQQQATAHAPIVVDVRSAEEYAAGHMRGALHIPADQVRERLAELPSDRPIVPY
jgi:rhodanese-related sulfurtransferase